MSRRKTIALAAGLLALSAVGCSPHFQALTTPPPLTTAELCDGGIDCGDKRTIRLTKGIALAFECFDDETYEPCTGVEATVQDPDVALIFDGYLTSLSPTYTQGSAGTLGAQPKSSLVIMGRDVGRTILSIHSDNGSADFEVTIEDF